MAYTSILDNSIVKLPMVKNYLRIDTDELIHDPILKIAIAAAKEAADNYCQDTFDDVPAGIEMWILSVIQLWWERKAPFIKAGMLKDIGSTEWGFNYDDYYHGLKMYRREVGFGR